MLTLCQRRKVVIVNVGWVMLVFMFIMGGGLYKQVGWSNIYSDPTVFEDSGEISIRYSRDAYF